MGFLNNSGVNYLWNKVKDYVDSRAIAGNIKQVQAQGWLEPRVVSVSATSLVVQFYNAGNAAHTGGAKFTLIEVL